MSNASDTRFDNSSHNISPILPDEEMLGDTYDRKRGLSGYLIFFTSLFERLIKLDPTAANQEFAAWIVKDETIFARLRIWASGFDQLLSSQEFGPAICDLGDDAFWRGRHQRDLLMVLANRWGALEEPTRIMIEERLLGGRNKWEGENDDEYLKHRALLILNRLHWMHDRGCNFTFDLNQKTQQLKTVVPEWTPEYAKKAGASLEGRGGQVETNTEHTALLTEPINKILTKANELRGRTEEFLVENDPFAGLSAKRPVRAFSSLTSSARGDEYPEWAWRTFLNSKARKSDKPKFSALIAERISRGPDEAIAPLIHPVSDWLLIVGDKLASNYLEAFDKVMSKLINLIRLDPTLCSSEIIRSNKEPDWAFEAINAPVGKMAQALMNDPRNNNLDKGAGFPTEWLSHADNLLNLNGDPRRHALVVFAFNLNWFYSIDPEWTEDELLSILDFNENEDRDAVWSGFLWSAKKPIPKIFMRIKSNLLQLTKEQNLGRHGYDEVLAGIILFGWGTINEETGKSYISNDELRGALLKGGNQFRSDIIWQIGKWSRESEQWATRLPEFLSDVWPRQKSAKTPTISSRLCELAFDCPGKFVEIAELILPLLTFIDSRDHLMLPNLGEEKETIVDLYPEKMLSLMWAILPENASLWPYGIEEILRRIGDADDDLKSDQRLLELKRIWNAR